LLELILLASCKLDDAGVVEVTNFLKAGLEDVSADVSIHLREGVELAQDGLADSRHIELVVGFVEEVSIDVTEGHHKQFLHQHDLNVIDLTLKIL
jgi:hypothetical protein